MKIGLNMATMGWTVLALELILLLIWAYSIFGTVNGTDPAGRGMAQVFLLGLLLYIGAGVVLMLMNNKFCTIAVLVMGAIPLTIVVFGLIRYYSTR